MSERFEIEWNEANSSMQSVLAIDPAFQGCAVEVEPEIRLFVVVEPGGTLNAASVAEIANASRLRPVVVVQGVNPKAELERALADVLAASTRLARPTTTKGLVIGIDYLVGKVHMRGDAVRARAIADESGVGEHLLLIEDGPGVRRL